MPAPVRSPVPASVLLPVPASVRSNRTQRLGSRTIAAIAYARSSTGIAPIFAPLISAGSYATIRSVTMTLSNTIVMPRSATPAISAVTSRPRRPVVARLPRARARRSATMPATTATTVTTAKNGRASRA
ncbi:hypothetical protein P9139_06795 [Curtobacterium flaccumfaciens]|nr:hypothetical protein P9139_06795 [Curtobacterium flaccumfaciens]